MNTPDHGVKVAGLNTTVLPVSSAGSALRHMTFIGKFHGLMMPTTPSGSYCSHPVYGPVPAGRACPPKVEMLVYVMRAFNQGGRHLRVRLADGLTVLERDDARQLVACGG